MDRLLYLKTYSTFLNNFNESSVIKCQGIFDTQQRLRPSYYLQPMYVIVINPTGLALKTQICNNVSLTTAGAVIQVQLDRDGWKHFKSQMNLQTLC